MKSAEMVILSRIKAMVKRGHILDIAIEVELKRARIEGELIGIEKGYDKAVEDMRGCLKPLIISYNGKEPDAVQIRDYFADKISKLKHTEQTS